MDKAAVRFDILFETSWEVCNKIGGIYTVLSTKAKTLQKLYKDKIIFIGPDVWSDDNPSPYFLESHTLLKEWKSKAQLPIGVGVRVGRWDIPGKPLVILVKFDGMYAVKNAFYGKMWELYHVDSLHAYGDYDEACAFSHAAGIVIEDFCKCQMAKNKKIIAHFDEWTTGMGLLYVKNALPMVSTIFTTHATCIGRSICGNNKPLYDYLKGYNGDQMAVELNMQSKHSLEKAAAHAADCFTTVSDITAIECEQLLERQPHIVTPNGFEQNFVPAKSEFTSKRECVRKKLLNVASSLIGKKLGNETFIVATSGRYEYRNKGIDLFLDAMAGLEELDVKRHVLVYIVVPAWVKEARSDLSKVLSHKNKKRLDDPIITHWLHNYNEDPIINRIHGIGFANGKKNRVTMIFVPCFLNGNDGIFNETYYDFLIGTDATIFPSYYEPWGYTPLESIAFGVPTITTSLSGFGQWILSYHKNGFDNCGVNVIARGDQNYSMVSDNIAHSLRYLIGRDDTELALIRRLAKRTASTAAWSHFIKYYLDAYKIAMDNSHKRNEKKTNLSKVII